MKIVILIFLVLAVATGTRGFNPEELKNFQLLYTKCAAEIGVDNEFRSDVFFCTIVKYGGFLHPNGESNKKATISKLTELISDPIKMEQALNIYDRCDKEVETSGLVGINKTMRMVVCYVPILSLLS